MLRTWSGEEMARLGEMVAAGMADAEIALQLGRSLDAVKVRRNRFFPKPAGEYVPGFGKTPPGRMVYWTEERVLAGLRDFAAAHKVLPTSDHEYSRLKKGHPEWPTGVRVMEFHGSMADAWAAVGRKVSRLWVSWTRADDDYLLEHAGEQTLKVIGKHLRRSWAACKRRLYDLGAGRARDVSGHLSAMQVAAIYDCPLARVKRLIAAGTLPAKRVQGGHYWRIEPEDCERIKAVLTARKTGPYRTSPPSHGDHDRRYGLKRVRVDGKVVRVARQDGDGIHVPVTKFRPYVGRYA